MEISSPRTYPADAHTQDHYPAPTSVPAPILVETGSPLADKALQADIKALARLVFTYYGLNWAVVRSRQRRAGHGRARAMLVLLWRVELGLPDHEAGLLLQRHSSTVRFLRTRLGDALDAAPQPSPGAQTGGRENRPHLPPPHTAYRLLRAEWARLHIDSTHAASPTPPAPERGQPLVMRSAQGAGGSAYGVGGGGGR